MRLFAGELNNNRITRFLKNIRNSLLNFYFLRKKVVYLSPQIEELFKSPALVFCIAFNKPICIQIMINCWSRFAKNTTLIVVDNSTDIDSRDEIRVICISNNIHYVGLPKNPEWHPNRSHALAMNWVYYNLTKKLSPKFFGFLDHDCFPFDKFDLTDLLKNKNFYGERKMSEKNTAVWNLWAGFCFYKYEYVKGKRMNFTHSVELGLDTGGCNYTKVYKDIDATNHPNCFAKSRKISPNLIPYTNSSFVQLDNFIHIGSASRNDKGNNIDLITVDFIENLNKFKVPLL